MPRDRLAGTFLITDGEVHDVPKPAAVAAQGPIHVLLTGSRAERDRRIEIVDAPGYGIVGGKVTVTDPQYLAAAAVYLASNEAGYVTGQTIHVNGGMAMV